jgi:hypothetical protein
VKEIAIITDAINALSMLLSVYCGIKYAIAYNIAKLITKLNSPNVIILIGSVIILIIGFITKLTTVSTAATSIAYQKFST